MLHEMVVIYTLSDDVLEEPNDDDDDDNDDLMVEPTDSPSLTS